MWSSACLKNYLRLYEWLAVPLKDKWLLVCEAVVLKDLREHLDNLLIGHLP